MTNTHYTCAFCSQTFEKRWTDEEAMVEATDVFGESNIIGQDVEVACDDCYNSFMQEQHRQFFATPPLPDDHLDAVLFGILSRAIVKDIIGPSATKDIPNG